MTVALQQAYDAILTQAFAATDDRAYDVLRDTATVLKLDLAKMN